MKKVMLLIFVSFHCYGETSFNKLHTVDLPPKAHAISYDDKGHIKQVTTSRWFDRVKTENGLVYQKFEQGYSYEKKQGFNFIYNDKDELLKENWNKNIGGGVSREELLIAFDVFKKDKTVQSHLKGKGETVSIHGGFNFIDNDKCQQGNRCVRVFASSPSIGLLVQSVVRLNDLSVVFPNIDMAEITKKVEKKR